jgi:hypothetical protein
MRQTFFSHLSNIPENNFKENIDIFLIPRHLSTGMQGVALLVPGDKVEKMFMFASF